MTVSLLACMRHTGLRVEWLRVALDVRVLQIINAMGGQIEKQQDANGCLSYWLSNTVTLLYLLQRNIKPASGGAYNARLRSPGSRYGLPGLPPAQSLCYASVDEDLICVAIIRWAIKSPFHHFAAPGLLSHPRWPLFYCFTVIAKSRLFTNHQDLSQMIGNPLAPVLVTAHLSRCRWTCNLPPFAARIV